MNTLNRLALRLALLLIALEIALWLGFTPDRSCQAQTDCNFPATSGRQPLPTEMNEWFQDTGENRLGQKGPAMPLIYKGYPQPTKVNAYVPCILLQAVAATESRWYHYDVNTYGESGNTLISFDCGYGIMQITTGMSPRPTSTRDPKFEGARVASEPLYNIGTGALFLVNKWNMAPYIGDNDPFVVEDWYYAIWAYNGWGWVNNPNNNCPLSNPDCGWAFNPIRPPFDWTPGSSTPRRWYPYQEIVYGYAAHPMKWNNQPLWAAQDLSLPPRELFSTSIPSWIPRPTPAHRSCGVNYLSIVLNLGPTPEPPTLTYTSTITDTATTTPTSTFTPTMTPTSTETATATPSATYTSTTTSSSYSIK